MFVILGILLIVFALLVTKLVALQMVDDDRYKVEGVQQREFTQTLAADRGNFYDRNGNELVVSRPAQSVFVDPGLIEDPRVEAVQVAAILGLEPADVEAKMRLDGRFAYLARKVTDDQANQIEALGLAGVALVEESTRFLPAGELASSILGTVDTDNVGISGLEMLNDAQLTGTPGRLSLERNPKGNTIATGEHNLIPAKKGDDLTLTIDRSLQYESERILGEQVGAMEAKSGTAIVMRPGTGEILAMANMVRDTETGEVSASSNNMAVTTTYEPGSTMKMLTVSAALDAGLVTPDHVVQTPSKLKIADAEFKDDHPIAGAMSVSDIVAYSSNTGTINISKLVGNRGLHDQLEKFGLNTKTSLDFRNEADGYLGDVEDWSDTSRPSIAIGQGVAVTPIQMLLAYNVIANGGRYVAPMLVSATTDSDGVIHRVAPDEGRRVVSEQTAQQLNLMLRNVVMEGTGTLATVPGYTSAGKTGTPWKPVDGGYQTASGGYLYQPNFVGFMPAQDPQLAVLVMIDEPSPRLGYTGGEVAAPVFSKIASFALQLFGIPAPTTDVAAGSGAITSAGGAGGQSGTLGDDRGDTALPPGVTRTEDGRVRGLPASESPPRPVPPVEASTSTTSATH